MNFNSRSIILILSVIFIYTTLASSSEPSSQGQAGLAKQNGTFFDKLRNNLKSMAGSEQLTTTPASPLSVSVTAAPADDDDDDTTGMLNDEEDEDDDDDDDDQDIDEDDDDDDLDANDDTPRSASTPTGLIKRGPEQPKVYDILGNQLKIEGNRTVIVLQNQARDLGLLTIKAILLGPLIGLTLKAALFRGLLWAVGAYFMHLFFPSLLSTLGLGTGLVGFARSAQPPDYTRLLVKAAVNYLEGRYLQK